MLKTLTYILKPYRRHISEWGMKEAFISSVICHAAFLSLLLLNFSFFPKAFNKENLILLDDIQVSNINNVALKSLAGDEIKYREIKNAPVINEPDPIKEIKPQVLPIKKEPPNPQLIANKPAAEVLMQEVKSKPSTSQPKPIVAEKKAVPPVKSTPKVEPSAISNKLLKHKPTIETSHSSEEEEQVASLLKSAKLKKDLKSGSQGTAAEGERGRGSSNFNKELPLSADIITAIKTQFIRCWIVPIGLQDLELMSIVVAINLDRKGNIISADVIKDPHYLTHPTYQVLAASALRAIYKCSPLKGLPQSHYIEWQEMELRFDPKEMI